MLSYYVFSNMSQILFYIIRNKSIVCFTNNTHYIHTMIDSINTHLPNNFTDVYQSLAMVYYFINKLLLPTITKV